MNSIRLRAAFARRVLHACALVYVGAGAACGSSGGKDVSTTSGSGDGEVTELCMEPVNGTCPSVQEAAPAMKRLYPCYDVTGVGAGTSGREGMCCYSVADSDACSE